MSQNHYERNLGDRLIAGLSGRLRTINSPAEVKGKKLGFGGPVR